MSVPGSGALAEGIPLTPALLGLDPMFDPLRKDSRFQELAGPPGIPKISGPQHKSRRKASLECGRLRIVFFAREAVSLVTTCG